MNKDSADPLLDGDLKAIAKHLNETALPWCIFGGAATRFYGNTRATADIDVLVLAKASRLMELCPIGQVNPNGTVEYGKVEICPDEILLHAAEMSYRWRFDQDVADRIVAIWKGDTLLKVISLEDLIVMKAILQRGEAVGKFDMDDLRALISLHSGNVDISYIRERASRCHTLDRVAAVLKSFGLDVSV